MKKKPVEYPADFLEFWEDADVETRMMAACVGYIAAKRSAMRIVEEITGGLFD